MQCAGVYPPSSRVHQAQLLLSSSPPLILSDSTVCACTTTPRSAHPTEAFNNADSVVVFPPLPPDPPDPSVFILPTEFRFRSGRWTNKGIGGDARANDEFEVDISDLNGDLGGGGGGRREAGIFSVLALPGTGVGIDIDELSSLNSGLVASGVNVRLRGSGVAGADLVCVE